MNDHIAIIQDMLQIDPHILDAKAFQAEVIIIDLQVDYHGFFLLN